MRSYKAWALLTAVSCAGGAHAAVGDNSVGVNIHVGYQSFIDAAAELGVAWVRVDGNWFAMEPSQGSYDWAGMDQTVTRANAANLKVFISLGYTPAWHVRHGDTDGQSHNDVPNDSTAWTAFVRAAVQHYRAMGVTHFGMWNEANLQGFFEGTPEEYVDLIAVPGAAAVREVCNDCKVLGPEAANVGDSDDWLEAVLLRAPLSTWDIITHHSYNSFAELGWNIWSGDSFINVLDQQRFPFTRRSLRQVLDQAGWTGEVWITETGYKAEPPGDVDEEDNQAIYVRRVLEEQLARAWYTNTFFYEIEDCGPAQPACDIDGYGLMRALTDGDESTKSFPADYRTKPAFSAIQDFIDAHPEISGLAPPPQCGDGEDNDGDGRVDTADRGCNTALDDDESDDPPRETLEAWRITTLTVDGLLDDVGTEGWLTLTADHWHGTEPLGANDHAVRAAARWADGNLWLIFDVTDDTHDNTHVDSELWMGDSVQLGFDIDGDGGDGYDAVDDQELNFALVGNESRAFRFHGPAAAGSNWQVAVRRDGTSTRYEILLPAAVLPGLTTTVDTEVGFSFLVNDADGSGRSGWTEWTPGIGVSKVPEVFGRIRLVPQEVGATTSSSSSSSSGAAVSSSSSGGASSSSSGSASSSGGASSSSSSSSGAVASSSSGGGGADGGTASAEGGSGNSVDGCACKGSGGTASLPWLLLGLVVLWRRRA
ncbi:MAG: sugar-binding protein [Myxococcota bacterium]